MLLLVVVVVVCGLMPPMLLLPNAISSSCLDSWLDDTAIMEPVMFIFDSLGKEAPCGGYDG
jgi:hypothetical protein